jgi:hypothetical protein
MSRVPRKFIKAFIKKRFEGPDEAFVTGGVEPVGTTTVAKNAIFSRSRRNTRIC